jgi:hypothetical protein
MLGFNKLKKFEVLCVSASLRFTIFPILCFYRQPDAFCHYLTFFIMSMKMAMSTFAI